MKSGLIASLLIILCFLLLFSKINLGKATAAVYIRADGTVDPSSAPIQRDGDVYVLTGNISSEADGVRIERSNITLDGSGFTVEGSSSSDSAGIYLANKANVTIRNLLIREFSYGIYLQLSSHNAISSNSITLTIWDCVKLSGSSSHNNITGNNLVNNNGNGVGLYSSPNNTIRENNIINNIQNGVYLYWSSNNSIYHNRFENNGRQAYTEQSQGNTWDNSYPSGGNYWSDYDGIDIKSGVGQNLTGSDGFGDSPYIINSLNKDRYPIVPEFSSFVALSIVASLWMVVVYRKKNSSNALSKTLQ